MKALHVFAPSPNAKKAMMVNVLTGLNLPLVEVDLRAGDQQAAAFLTLNPNGKIPVLEMEEGEALWEANAIINFMASEAGGEAGSALWPLSKARYDILRWQFWEACHWTPACGKFIGKYLFQRDGIDMDAAAEEFHRFAAVLNGHLAGRDWLVGSAMSTADISVVAILAYKDLCHYPLGDYAEISRWFDRIAATEAWAAANPS